MRTQSPSRLLPAAVLCATAALLFCLTPPATAQGNYRLTPGDLVDVSVFQEKDLSGSYRISGDGTINVPLIGLVVVAGQMESSAAALIRQRLLDGYLVDPQVTLRVAEYAKLRFTVLGQVREPKAIAVNGNEKINLLQAIGLAGGFTRLAKPGDVTVKRSSGGKTTVIRVDAKKMAEAGSGASFLVQAGDIITVGERRF